MQKNVVLSTQASDILTAINQPNTKLGDLRKWAKDIKRNHELALELWSTESFFCPHVSNFNYGSQSSIARCVG